MVKYSEVGRVALNLFSRPGPPKCEDGRKPAFRQREGQTETGRHRKTPLNTVWEDCTRMLGEVTVSGFWLWGTLFLLFTDTAMHSGLIVRNAKLQIVSKRHV